MFVRESERFLDDGSRWRLASGEAVDGSHEEIRIGQANTAAGEFSFSWKNVRPEIEVRLAG